ncbi:MAG: G-D-S-L family lipolytic protein [Flavobacteriaceae bacterium]
MKIKYITILLLSLGFIACEEDDNTMEEAPVVLTAGSADFTNYVSLGASFTAGFSDGALFVASQENSFPNILSQQFAAIGGGAFSQPLMNDNIGGLLLGGNVIANPRLFFNGSGPTVLPALPTTEVTNVIAGPYNNMGVPGAKSFHLLANGYGNLSGVSLGLANPYFARMASSANASMLEDALAQSPTFFTLSEIGGNDVLGFSISGGSGFDQTGNFDPTTYGSNDITDPNVFAQAFTTLVGALTSTGAKGVVTNVPYVTSLPYFTTVPYAPLDPTNPDFGPQIPVLNATLAPLNQAFAFLGVPERSIVFSETAASPVVIFDESLPNISAQLNAVLVGGGLDPLTAQLLSTQFAQSRQATANDLLVLPSSTVIATLNEDYFNTLVGLGVPPATAGQLAVNGITYPLEDRWVLTQSEETSVRVATDAYNTTIEGVAASSGLALVDLNGILQQASTTGIAFDDFTMTTNLVVGGLVSLDGIHLTARGYALMANKFLEAIDTTYGSNFIEAGQVAKANNYPVAYSPELQ